MKEIELIGKRKINEKHFLRENGLMIAEVYNENIHYLKDGKYIEIDNSLEEDDKYLYTKDNSYKVSFAKISDDELCNIKIENKYINIKLKNCNSSNIIENKTNSKLHKNVCYENILKSINLEYNIMPSKVKEAIILKDQTADVDNLKFIIDTNMDVKIIDSKKIDFYIEDKKYFEFDTPYMVDANYVLSNNVFYEINSISTHEYLLEVKVDKNWLQEADRKYPIIIDPTIINSGESNSVYDTYIYPGDSGIDRNSQDFLKVGKEVIGGNNIVYRTLLKFTLPNLGTGSQVVSASLNLKGYPIDPENYTFNLLNAHQITTDWNESDANWNSMNDKYNSQVEGIIFAIRGSYDYNQGIINPGNCGGDITRIVKKWYTGTPNYGIMLKHNELMYDSSVLPMFYSKNNNMSGANPKPLLVISYRNQNGIEDYMDYQIQKFTFGSSYVNNYNGNMTSLFELGETIGGKKPVELNIVYNTNDVVLDRNIGYGLGWKFDMHQTIKERLIGEQTYLEYCDSDGTLHYFINQQITFDENGYNIIDTNNVYYDEDGLDLEITKYNTYYILKDKNNNKYKFNIISDTGYLSEVEDASGNINTILYNNDNLISKITDANNCEINIIYNTNSIEIISPNKTVTINYTNNKLTSISYSTGNVVFEYNLNNIITKITDINSLKKIYQYYDQPPYKVRKVLEYGTENGLGNTYEFTYGFDSTTITDMNGKAKTIVFNSQGSINSISSLKSFDNIRDAYAFGQVNGINSDGISNNINNKLLKTETILKYVNNMLSNTSFELNNIEFSSIGNANISISTDSSYSGLKSLKIENQQLNEKVYQDITVEKGKYYTFSAYIKNSNNVKLFISYVDENNSLVQIETETIVPNSMFERHDVTIEYPTTALSDLSIGFILNDTGITYVDDIQLEEGKVANYYNYIENSNFSNGISDWEFHASDYNTGAVLPTNDKFELITLSDGYKAIKAKKDPAYYLSMERTFNVSGIAGDKFNLSFWYKNNGVDSNLSMDYGSRVDIYFNYINQEDGYCILSNKLLNMNDEAWQFMSNEFVAEYDYSSITVIFTHIDDANDICLTNLYLIKNVNSTDFIYDEDGNIITSTSLNNTNNFVYDKNNELIKMMNAKGDNFRIEYDNISTDKILNGISDMGISNMIKYNEHGVPIFTQLINKTDHILNNSLYRIRLKGTNKFIGFNGDSITLNENENYNCWYLNNSNDEYTIQHGILNQKYLTNNNTLLVLSDYVSSSSNFSLEEQANGSYLIKSKSDSKYVKYENGLLRTAEIDEDIYNYQFYIEKANNMVFVENTAEYTSDGKYVTKVIDSLLREINYNYNQNTGYINNIIDSKGNNIEYTYNNQNKITKIKQNNRQVIYEYDNNNNLYKIKHGTKEYIFGYDEFLNNNSIKLGNITLLNNVYGNNNGLLTASQFGNGQSIQYVYDDFDRLKTIIKNDDEINYIYGNTGNLQKIITNDDIIKYTYDLSNRLYQYHCNDFGIKYLYDSNGNLKSKIYKLKNSVNVVENTLDDDSSIKEFKFDNSKVEYSYDSLGRIIQTTINNDYSINQDYKNNGYRTSFVLNSMTIDNEKFMYEYDEYDNITHIYLNGELINKYYYDDIGQLIKEKNYELGYTILYTYDNVGNILSRKVYKIDTYELICKDKYEYSNLWEDQMIKHNNDVITYDQIGNPISIGNDITLEWKNGRELTKYCDTQNTINYKYNQDGLRISKEINGNKIKYKLEDNNIVYEEKGNDIIYYCRNSLGDLVALEYNNSIYYYVKNAQNDIVKILDSNNNVVANYVYDSWGNIISITNAMGNDISTDSNNIANINPFRYRSYYYDKETGLYYINSRYYNPKWMRFINPDSILNSNQDIMSYNLYLYCSNDPINNIDSGGKGLLKSLVKTVKKVVKKVVKAVKTVVQKLTKTNSNNSNNSNNTTKKVTNTKKTSTIKTVDMCNPTKVTNNNASGLKDYTEMLNESMSKNQADSPKIALSGRVFSLLYFYQQEKSGGEWDYKLPSKWEDEYGDTYLGRNTPFIYDKYIIDAEAWGNIHYGYIGTSIGFSPFTLFTGGGYAAKGLKLEIIKGPYHGDAKDDHCAIQFGIDLYNSKYK